jgi:lysophospholipase L1-like esterase
MGGSTTLCAVLDDSQTWPALVQNRLQRTAQGQSIWIGNIGKNGLATRNHVLQLRYLLPQHSVDAVLLLVGINDLMLGLAESDDDVSQIVQRDKNRPQLMHQTFDVVPDSLIQPFYKRFVIWKLARQTKSYLKNHFDRSDEFAGLKIWRDYRRNGREVAMGPDLTAALEEYARNLTEIITLAKQQNIRLIMMTQPTLWHENMSPEEQEALFLGFVGDPRRLADHPHYSTEVLAQGMESYNQMLLQLCREYKVEYIDLAALVPRNLQVMYDECHFTVLGAQLVAGIIVDYLRASPPFAIGEKQNRLN